MRPQRRRLLHALLLAAAAAAAVGGLLGAQDAPAAVDARSWFEGPPPRWPAREAVALIAGAPSHDGGQGAEQEDETGGRARGVAGARAHGGPERVRERDGPAAPRRQRGGLAGRPAERLRRDNRHGHPEETGEHVGHRQVGADVAETRRFYGEALGLEALVDTETAPAFLEVVNKLTGTPPGTPVHWLLYAGRGEPSGKILVVLFGGAPGKRLAGRMRPGRLGFSLMTHFCAELEALAVRLEAAGAAIVTPPVRIEWNGAPRRILLARGPNEELFEYVEGVVAR